MLGINWPENDSDLPYVDELDKYDFCNEFQFYIFFLFQTLFGTCEML